MPINTYLIHVVLISKSLKAKSSKHIHTTNAITTKISYIKLFPTFSRFFVTETL